MYRLATSIPVILPDLDGCRVYITQLSDFICSTINVDRINTAADRGLPLTIV